MNSIHFDRRRKTGGSKIGSEKGGQWDWKVGRQLEGNRLYKGQRLQGILSSTKAKQNKMQAGSRSKDRLASEIRLLFATLNLIAV